MGIINMWMYISKRNGIRRLLIFREFFVLFSAFRKNAKKKIFFRFSKTIYFGKKIFCFVGLRFQFYLSGRRGLKDLF